MTMNIRHLQSVVTFFFNDPAPTEIYPLSLHDALPILHRQRAVTLAAGLLQDVLESCASSQQDRKSTRLNSSHLVNAYAVYCLKKNIQTINDNKLLKTFMNAATTTYSISSE